MKPKCQEFIQYLCLEIPERPVGSPGNLLAGELFEQVTSSWGWQVDKLPFQAIHWVEQGASFQVGDCSVPVKASPYSLGCDLNASLTTASTVEELETGHFKNTLLLLRGELTKEQLMPKNFSFYNPDSHQQIIALLEKKQPAAILTATDRNASLAGGIYPFPLIEDGDFDIPSVYLQQEDGELILPYLGKPARLRSRAERFSARAAQLVAHKGTDAQHRYVISAHIDAKIGTPGALDNASGVAILLLLAELLKDYDREAVIELVPFNGEDYFSAPGQMAYLKSNQGKLNTVELNINIDGAGYKQGPTAISIFDLPDRIRTAAWELIEGWPEVEKGEPWYQGDHSIFLQQGVPAVAVTSSWFLKNIDSQEITHTAADHPRILDCEKIADLANFIYQLVLNLTAR